MSRIFWLDDETMSISYEVEILLPERLKNYAMEIKVFEFINELLEFISKNKIKESDIFIIDVMLLDEEVIKYKEENILIPDELMAGATLYSELIKKYFPKNKVILYTSRENDQAVFQNIINTDEFNKTVFLIGKSQKDSLMVEILEKIFEEEKC